MVKSEVPSHAVNWLVELLSESTDPVRLQSSTEGEQQEGCADSGR